MRSNSPDFCVTLFDLLVGVDMEDLMLCYSGLLLSASLQKDLFTFYPPRNTQKCMSELHEDPSNVEMACASWLLGQQLRVKVKLTAFSVVPVNHRCCVRSGSGLPSTSRSALVSTRYFRRHVHSGSRSRTAPRWQLMEAHGREGDIKGRVRSVGETK